MYIDSARIYNMQRLARKFNENMTSVQREKIALAADIPTSAPHFNFIKTALEVGNLTTSPKDV